MSTTQNDTFGIAQTVQRSLDQSGRGEYLSYAGPVIEALVQREQSIATAIINAAGERSVDEDEVRDLLSSFGMEVAPVEHEDEDDEDIEPEDSMSRIEQMLTRLTGRIDSLTQFARDNGYRG